MTSSEAPTIPRCCFTVRRVRFLAISCRCCVSHAIIKLTSIPVLFAAQLALDAVTILTIKSRKPRNHASKPIAEPMPPPSPKLPALPKNCTNLGNTLSVLATEQDCPCNATRVLALEEKGFGLAILETENLAVTADIELALQNRVSFPLR